jgi:phosphoglucosamine mutase
MANLGLDLAMRNNDIKVFKTRVGDRYVLEEMQKNQAVVGGEQSGHIILAEHATTGDGLLTACNLLRIMRETGATIKELSGVMSKLPQVLVNIRVKTKDFDNVPEIVEAIRDTEKRLSGRGRVLVRPSGTENLVRVMAEGPDEGEIKGLVESIARTISSYLC